MRPRPCRWRALVAGGVPLIEITLRTPAAPIADMQFCPTGGIDAERARVWRRLPLVACVGGSWLTPPDRLAAGDWQAVTARARASLP